ncbi:DUF3267 domain-containing protein [Edaphobacillus lindanitolerans]|uniref:Putative zincin peptidase n=1 Tax=Edaphobacillus lindanitolerans TaxID=550447 RepID=A0A1U7PNX8_9BACI|nr:DUF3267 domain-containing protein [Edaphobacillus lindanitolerans]SIT87071.1 Putative zincin peptidase [Edaphobacillus lindanitolerans]
MDFSQLEGRNPDRVIELDLPKVAKESLWLTLLSAVILFLANALLHGVFRQGGFEVTFSLKGIIVGTLLFIAGYAVLIVVHEAFHLLGFRLFGGVPFKEMAFGLNLQAGIAYATTKIPLHNRGMRKALLLPLWMTGILPAAIGLWTDSYLVLFLSAWLIGGAAGDLAMDRELKTLPGDWLIRDDPEEPKLYVFSTDPGPDDR